MLVGSAAVLEAAEAFGRARGGRDEASMRGVTYLRTGEHRKGAKSEAKGLLRLASEWGRPGRKELLASVSAVGCVACVAAGG